jgi:mannose-1-phosphate guanylyltransferase
MNKNYYAVIMAGGIGSRFWPISTQEYPKQFHDMLGGGITLLQQTFDRFKNLIPSENILIATNEKYEALVLEQLKDATKSQLLLEPNMRNTAPCILYSALKIYSQNKDAIMIVAPSDHWIEQEKAFLENVQTSFDFCEENDDLLTLGIQPNSPNTGYGYIQYSNSENAIKKVDKFTEKPNLERAQKFLKQGNYLWNAGIFIWSAKSILKAFESHLPQTYNILSKNLELYNSPSEKSFIDENYKHCKNVSIDFGIMEKAANVKVLPANFDWNDLGTWASLYEKLDKDSSQNATVGGAAIYRNAENNMVKTQSGKRVVIQGLSDYIIVEKEDVLLICPKNKEQEIKQLRSDAKTEFGEEFV